MSVYKRYQKIISLDCGVEVLLWLRTIINQESWIITSGRICWESSSCENTCTNFEKCFKSSILIWLSLTPNNCISLGFICSLKTPRLKNPGISPLVNLSENKNNRDLFWKSCRYKNAQVQQRNIFVMDRVITISRLENIRYDFFLSSLV